MGLQKPGNPIVSLFCGQVQRGSSLSVLEGRLGSEEEEVLTELEIPRPGGDVEGGIPRIVGKIKGSSPVQKKLAGGKVAG